jgi:hypothetical protein
MIRIIVAQSEDSKGGGESAIVKNCYSSRSPTVDQNLLLLLFAAATRFGS